jgi:hypothetical protein
MIRGLVFALALVLTLPTVASAQVCTNPRCAPGTHCIYVGTSDDANNATTCIKDAENGTAAEVVAVGNAPAQGGMDFAGAVASIIKFFDAYIIPLLYALAFLLFLVGVMRYFFTGGEENREKARPFVIWGLIGLTLIFALWGVVNLLLTALPGV